VQLLRNLRFDINDWIWEKLVEAKWRVFTVRSGIHAIGSMNAPEKRGERDIKDVLAQ
jgi:hypothetical protein